MDTVKANLKLFQNLFLTAAVGLAVSCSKPPEQVKPPTPHLPTQQEKDEASRQFEKWDIQMDKGKDWTP